MIALCLPRWWLALNRSTQAWNGSCSRLSMICSLISQLLIQNLKVSWCFCVDRTLGRPWGLVVAAGAQRTPTNCMGEKWAVIDGESNSSVIQKLSKRSDWSPLSIGYIPVVGGFTTHTKAAWHWSIPDRPSAPNTQPALAPTWFRVLCSVSHSTTVRFLLHALN